MSNPDPLSGTDIDVEALGEALIEFGERLTGESEKPTRLQGATFSHEFECNGFSGLELSLQYNVQKDDVLYDPVDYDTE